MDKESTIIFGIDLGTTYSCIAYTDRSGQPTIIANSDSELTTPSVVLFEEEDECIVGKVAKGCAISQQEHVVELVKRFMGKREWYFSHGREYSAPEISSYILRKLAKDAHDFLGVEVKDVVITCPAYFDSEQREATKQAGEIAGLRVWSIINEPTAAAIMYGLQNQKDQVVLVYDLGGGTFDVTIISIKTGDISVIATGGDASLGGSNWDEALIWYFAEQWAEATNQGEDPLESRETVQDLRRKAEEAKRILSTRKEIRVDIFHAGQKVQVALTRDKFNELTAGLLESTIEYTKCTIQAATQKGYDHIDCILLVGGSTRMPQVAARLREEFPDIPYRMFEPETAVAKGAAMYGHKLMIDRVIDRTIEREDTFVYRDAAIRQAQKNAARTLDIEPELVRELNELSIVNVTSHSFGVVIYRNYRTPRRREVISNLIKVNDPLPVSKTQQYRTLEDNQTKILLRIMETREGTDVVEMENIPSDADIKNAVLPLPIKLAAGSPIDITFELNEEGLLRILAREPHSGSSISATIERRGVLSKAEVQEARRRTNRLNIS